MEQTAIDSEAKNSQETDAKSRKSDKAADNQQAVKKQYLTFKMGDDEFGVDILSVQEIHGWIEPRPMPDTPPYIRGVIDWRETVVPIIDLRIRFAYDSVTYDKSTVVIILKSELQGVDHPFILGIVVDAVSDVHDVEKKSMREAPRLGGKIDTKYIKGIAKVHGEMIILLELNKLFKLEEFE
ncbi:chemotaxis protein CheW [Aliikangiella maris]|uniref:Chemotaxis protein CheW n=2 Tax=Aliikangiella maris TaxID=3162458 RepID=A0ABV3MPE8_9GAMM